VDEDPARRLAGPLEGTPVSVGAVTLDAHVSGPADGEVVLLVAGLGMPRISWPPELVDQLHAAGYRTVAADNRDTGRSTVLPGGLAGLERTPDGRPAALYSLTDLAGDLVGLLDHLEVASAHVLGVSMGGMIAQRIAIDRPERVATLHLIMTTTGDWSVGLPHEGVSWVLTTPVPDDLDGFVAHQRAAAEATGSPGLVDAARVEAQVRTEYARGVHPEGTARQLAAILADPDRTPDLRALSVPTVVVHGAEDPLIGVSGGRAVAAAIRDARYVEVPGMGHDLPPELLGTFLPTMLEVMAATPAGR
jgi:pimeloyl-ACP methyl ester carboxylesterase